MTAPVVEQHRGVIVVRDDLFPGGTKARYIGRVFDGAAEADSEPASYDEASRCTGSTSACFRFTACTILVRALRRSTSSPPDRSTRGAGAARCHATVVFFAATDPDYRPPGTLQSIAPPSSASSALSAMLPHRSVRSTGTGPKASSAFRAGWP